MKKIFLTSVVAAALCMMAVAAHAGPNSKDLTCDLITENPTSEGGLYMTDGLPGLIAVAFVKYGEHRNRIHVCEMGIRFPDPKRITHCLPTGVCPRGEPVNVDFLIPEGKIRKGPIRFKSVGLSVNVQGHDGTGNFEEFRRFWQDCEAANTCPADPSISFSQKARHIDAHFYLEPRDKVNAISWTFPIDPDVPPPDDIQDKCDCEPAKGVAANRMYYSERDCTPFQGRHWAEDKFESAGTFLFQPALKFSTYSCRPLSWMLGVTSAVFDWIVGNTNGQTATISYPHPEKFFKSGQYPTHYIVERSEPGKEIGGGRTFQVALSEFEFKRGSRNHRDDDDDDDDD